MNSENKHLWHGRFELKAADDLMAYTESISFDRRLWLDDITGSRAHARMLGHVGLLSVNEVDAIIQALATIEKEMLSSEFRFLDSDEDIHTAIERRVTEIAGAAGAKLHTARSRNDQVATAFRLWTKRELGVVCGARESGNSRLRVRRRIFTWIYTSPTRTTCAFVAPSSCARLGFHARHRTAP